MSQDIILVDIGAYIQASSTTSLAVATGIKTFVLSNDTVFDKAMTVTASDGAGNSMTGTVTSYTSSTTTLVLNIASVIGSGTHATWTIGGETTLRYGNNGGFDGKPTDTPANVTYLPFLENPGSYSQFIYQNGTTFGRSQVGYGTVSLNNTGRELDKLLKYGFDGKTITIYRGKKTSAFPSGFTTVFTGTMSQIEDSGSYLNLLIRDSQALVSSLPLQTVKYGGTNALPAGVDGVAADLKGKPIPLLYGGMVEGITPPMVNTSKQTYQINYRQINSIDAVYHGANTVAVGTGHASLALLQAAVVAGGTYDYYLGSGSDGAYFRMGSAVTLQVTCDATQGANAAARTTAQIASNILALGGKSFTAGSIAALDTANSSVIGVWFGTEEETIGNALDKVFNGAGGFWSSKKNGDFVMGILLPPIVTPDQTLYDHLLLGGQDKITRISSNDNNGSLPIKRATGFYRKNYTVQTASDVTGVALPRLTFLSSEYRSAISALNSNTILKHPLCEEMQFDTLFTVEANAQTEVDRRAALYANDYYIIEVSAKSVYTKTYEINQTILLSGVRAFYAQKYILIGISEDFKLDETRLQLLKIGS